MKRDHTNEPTDERRARRRAEHTRTNASARPPAPGELGAANSSPAGAERWEREGGSAAPAKSLSIKSVSFKKMAFLPRSRRPFVSTAMSTIIDPDRRALTDAGSGDERNRHS